MARYHGGGGALYNCDGCGSTHYEEGGLKDPDQECPDLVRANNAIARKKAEWQRGYNYGFGDNNILWWHRGNYSTEFLQGWRAGKAEIDRLVDEAAQGNARGDEY